MEQRTVTNDTKPTIVGISGSLRSGSYNGAILETLATRVEDRATIRVWRLNDIPGYDQDLDTDVAPQPDDDQKRGQKIKKNCTSSNLFYDGQCLSERGQNWALESLENFSPAHLIQVRFDGKNQQERREAAALSRE